MFGGENAADFIQKAFAGTPLSGLIGKALTAAGGAVNGSGTKSASTGATS
jgi:hypothetical protein